MPLQLLTSKVLDIRWAARKRTRCSRLAASSVVQPLPSWTTVVRVSRWRSERAWSRVVQVQKCTMVVTKSQHYHGHWCGWPIFSAICHQFAVYPRWNKLRSACPINCPADIVPSYRWRNCDCHQTFEKACQKLLVTREAYSSCILDSCTITASHEVSQAQKALLLLPRTEKESSTSSEELTYLQRRHRDLSQGATAQLLVLCNRTAVHPNSMARTVADYYHFFCCWRHSPYCSYCADRVWLS